VTRIKMNISKTKLSFYPPSEVKCGLQNRMSTKIKLWKYPNHWFVMCFPTLLFQSVRILQTLVVHFTASLIIFNAFKFSPTHWWDLSLLSLSLYTPLPFFIFHTPITSKRWRAFIWRKVKPFQCSKRYSSVGRFFMFLLSSSPWCTRICTTQKLEFLSDLYLVFV